MHDYQREFIEFALDQQALLFGDFTLKSGRKSPYFFNAGVFNTGRALAQLGHYYAAALIASCLNYDVLFGPAYKGIPLVSAAAIALATDYNQDKPFCFNRKVAKDHGEGGVIVGAPLKGRVVIVDDVITAGTAVRESMKHIEQAQAQLAGILIALDRQEKGLGALSAIQEIEQQHSINVIRIISLSDLVQYLQENSKFKHLVDQFEAYREQYGVAAKANV